MSLRQALKLSSEAYKPKPFLKWAGGKSRLIAQLEPFFPKRKVVYFEPFIGGGAVFLHLASTGKIKKAFLNDLNSDLALLYSVIKLTPAELIQSCVAMSNEYLKLDTTSRAAYYYDKRKRYNEGESTDPISRAATTIFLNKTCFNGLFRVNSKGEFNVPAGKYKSPTIIEPENIFAVNRILNDCDAEILCEDFADSVSSAEKGNFVYYDPPYRPLNKTACFTAYSAGGFEDNEQVRLAELFATLSLRGVKQMLSNSDPKNVNPDDKFFDDLYGSFKMRRVIASRNISSNGEKRGSVSELLITNY